MFGNEYTDGQLKNWIENEKETNVLSMKADLVRKAVYGDEVYVQCRNCLESRVKNAGYRIVTSRGDVKK